MSDWQKALDNLLGAGPPQGPFMVNEKEWWHQLDETERENYAAARCDCGSAVGPIPCELPYEVAPDDMGQFFIPFVVLGEEYEVRCESCQVELDAQIVAEEAEQEREYRLFLWEHDRGEYHYLFGVDSVEVDA